MSPRACAPSPCNAAHETMSTAMFVLLVAHNALNWR